MRFWLLLLTLTTIARADEMFPFVLPWDDASTNIVNISDWLVQPAGKGGYVVARDGHFFVGPRRVKFFGVNLVGPGAFPQHAAADKIAARMAKFGINCVRFHHLDAAGWSPLIDTTTGDSRHFNADALDRLDYLIAQLKRNGIYTDLNLLTLRTFKPADGLPAEIAKVDIKDQHILACFVPALLELQQERARQLLTHTNAYTQLPYTSDPAVALVEINNENGLIQAWLSGRLDHLPEVFTGRLRAQWNDWLRARYSTTEKLRTAWKARNEPLGNELLTGRWLLEQHAGSRATETNGQITVTHVGDENWHVQYNQPGLAVTPDQPVTLTFRAKADQPCEISVALMQAHEPWRSLGLDAAVKLTAAWQDFHFTFTPTQTDTNARVNLGNLGLRLGKVWFTDVSLRPGGVLGFPSEANLKVGTIPVLTKAYSSTIEAQRDWMRFLWETEDAYWRAMNRYLKDDLHVHANIIGTIVGCSPPVIQAQFDAVDGHAYWQHPQFPGKAWDPDNWIVENKSMVNELGGVLPGLATKRVPGKPFCVTEYNHPAPNSYRSEAFPLLAAFAASQDWDAIFAFAYSHRKDDWDARHFPNFFDIDQDPVRMVTGPAAVAMFVRGDVPAARELASASMDKEKEIESLVGSHAWNLGVAGAQPASLLDNGALKWERGLVTLNTPTSRMVIGYSGGRRCELGNFTIEPRAPWSAITFTEMQPHRWLITATGASENTGMQWKDTKKDSGGRNWGTAPSLVEGIPATIKMPGVVRVWALDERGQRTTELPVAQGQFEIGPNYRTLWYEVEQR